MRSPTLLALLACALAAMPGILATPIVGAQHPVLALEGHTLFAAIEPSSAGPHAPVVLGGLQSPGASATGAFVGAMPHGVRWLNDQLLARTTHDFVSLAVLARDENVAGAQRTPCTGAILVVSGGDPDPRVAPWDSGNMQANYIESYLITDPNDRAWNVDAWVYTGDLGVTERIWTVAILGNQAGSYTWDDGVVQCNPVADHALPAISSANGMNYPDGGTAYDGHLLYNGVIVIPVDALTYAGADVDHAPGSVTRATTPSVCYLSTCPNGNAFAQGNSHAFKFMQATFPSQPDGGSGASGEPWTHATRLVDVYYGIADVPLVRNYAIVDTEGALAPS